MNDTTEIEPETLIRPQSFKDFIGQKNIINQIEIMLQSAKIRNSPIDHILFAGPPGLGKTSLGMLMGMEQNTQFHFISGPAIEKKADLAQALAGLSPHDILFIDEIHRLPIVIEEVLYSAMEDFRLDIILNGNAQNSAAKTMRIDIAPFTLVAATTKMGQISRPLRDRFVAHFSFDYYNQDELEEIILNYIKKEKLNIDKESLQLIASCSRGTPRVALKLARRLRDYCIVEDKKNIELSFTKKVLKKLDIDDHGLHTMDQKFMKLLFEQFHGGPTGLSVLAAAMGEDKNTIEEVYEPYLILKGLIQRSARGRMLSPSGEDYCQSKF